MALSTTATAEDLARTRGHSEAFAESSRSLESAVWWGAIAARAAAAAAASLSLILLILGVGLGLSSVSPWASSAYGAQWLFISLLIGAFVASLAATFGGRRRDA